jgi:uncharacterized membrane protein YebE (DUF533 family)
MFNAKDLLDVLMRGGGQPRGQGGGGFGDLGELLEQLRRGQQGGGPEPDEQPFPRGRSSPGEPPMRGRPEPEDAGGDLLPGPRIGGGTMHRLGADAGPPPEAAGSAPGGAGGLEDMLRNVLGGQGGGLGDILGKLQQQGGGIADILGQVLGQATQGVREGAGRIDDATGASTHARDALGRATGKSPEELVQQIRDLIANNQLGAGAALGGLGAILLGTGAGRSLAASAIKLGGLALIGGLAYKAYQNYQQGQPVLTGRQAPQQALLAAPAGSGFEPAAVTNENATLLIRAMIAAAAADGRIDAKEQQGIIGGLEQAGVGSGAREFLMREAGNPASIAELADAVGSPQEALQVYTAARIAVDPDEQEEHAFLTALADRLGIDAKLAAQVDAAARGAGA